MTSGQKLDLDELAFRAHRFDDKGLLALVAAVRAARKFSHSSGHLIYRRQLEAALAPFTDSAESASGVRSDD